MKQTAQWCACCSKLHTWTDSLSSCVHFCAWWTQGRVASQSAAQKPTEHDGNEPIYRGTMGPLQNVPCSVTASLPLCIALAVMYSHVRIVSMALLCHQVSMFATARAANSCSCYTALTSNVHCAGCRAQALVWGAVSISANRGGPHLKLTSLGDMYMGTVFSMLFRNGWMVGGPSRSVNIPSGAAAPRYTPATDSCYDA